MRLQTYFIGAIFITFSITMLFFNGKADMNAYGEGWFEVGIAGTLFVLGLILFERYDSV